VTASRESVHDLLSRPARGRVLGHIEADHAPAMVSEHDKDEEHAQVEQEGDHQARILADRS
jgi:hypothetical protein